MLLAVVAVTAGLMVWLQLRHVRRVAAERRDLLGSVQHVLDQPGLEQRGIDYPVLTGVHRGSPVTVAVIVDTLNLRQLPTLWLSVTVREPLPLTDPVDMLLRPSTADIVSPGERFPDAHPVPPDWPDHIRVATPSRGAADLGVLSAALPLLHERATKDVLVTPTGVRAVTELARAELGHYRIVKRSKFAARLSAEELTAALDAVHCVVDGVRQASAGRRGAVTRPVTGL
jgi:hypothetical protein